MSNHSPLMRNSLRIGAGAVSGQAILLLSTPLLAWLFGPAEFGAYTLLLAIAAVITPVAALKFDTAILLPRTDEETRKVARCALLAILCVSTLALLLTAAVKLYRGDSLSTSRIFGLGVAALVCSGAVVTTMTQAAVRQRQFKVVASRPIIQNFCSAVVQLGLGVWLPFAAILVGGQVVGRSAGIVRLWHSGKDLLRRPEELGVRGVARKYWRFPAIFAPSALLNSLGAQLPILIVGVVSGPVTIGVVGMAERIAFSPTSIIATAISQPFSSEVSSLKRHGQPGAVKIYVKTSARVGVLAIALGLAVAFIGPPLVGLVLGPEWIEVEGVLRLLALPVTLNLVFNSVSRVFSIYEAARASLLADSSRVALVLLGSGIALMLKWGTMNVYASALVGLSTSYLFSWALGFYVVVRAGRIAKGV